MNKRTFQAIAVFASAAAVVAAVRTSGSVIVTGGIQPPEVTIQPTNEMIEVGADTEISVTKHAGWHYQWLRNGTPLKGETTSKLKLDNVQTDDAGYYCCDVDTVYGAVQSGTSSMQTYVVVDPDPDVVVYALPIVSSGRQNSCPGAFKGYVNYPPPTGWGWVPATNTTLFTATDTNRTNTKVAYVGYYGDAGCADTTVTVPYPLVSPQYGFTIYFTNNVPTNAYALELVGFNLP